MKDFYDFGIKVDTSRKGNQKVFCPKCHHNRKHKYDKSLSVDTDEGVWNCHNCGWSGSLKGKSYTIPKNEPEEIDDRALNWLIKKRGISKDAIKRRKVGSETVFMPQVNANRSCIAFSYYKGGNLINIKYRDGEKNFRMVKGAEKTLYGLDLINHELEYVIVSEGEIDALSWDTVGVYNSLSVPNGASVDRNNLDYLNDCLSYLEGKTIYIATDNDEAGRSLQRDLARRFGAENCMVIYFPEDCKDANDVLLHEEESLRDCFENAKPYPVDGIHSPSEYNERVMYLMENGLPKGNETGFEELDDLITWQTNEVVVVTGIPSHGKSVMLDQLMVNMAGRNGNRFGIWSPEKPDISMHSVELTQKIVEKGTFKEKCLNPMSKEEYLAYSDFRDEHFHFIEMRSNVASVDNILSKATYLVRAKGIDYLIIDNWSYVENDKLYEKEGDAISQALNKMKMWSHENDCGVWLVAHTTKMQKKTNGEYPMPDGYSISGSAHWFNKPDVGVTIYRDKHFTSLSTWKVRNWWTGNKGEVHFSWQDEWKGFKEQGRISTSSDSEHFNGQPYSDDVLQ